MHWYALGRKCLLALFVVGKKATILHYCLARVVFFKDIYGFGDNGAYGVVEYGAAGVS